MKMWSNDYEWFIAETREEAIQFSIEMMGGFDDYIHTPDQWLECDPLERFEYTEDVYDEKSRKIAASFRWFCENYPEGLFASSVW